MNHTNTNSSSSSSSNRSMFQYGLLCKASPYDMNSWMNMILTLDGRDKVTKLIQYIARLLAWYYTATATGDSNNNSKNNNTAQRFTDLKTSLVNSRKAFRLGRSFMELYKLYTMNIVQSILSKKNNNEPLWKTIGNGIKGIGLCCFWGGDNVSYLTMSGFLDNYSYKSQQQRYERRKQLQTNATTFANRSYFIGALAGLYVNVRSYYEYCYSTTNKNNQTTFRTIERQMIELQQQQQQQQQRRNHTSDGGNHNNDDDDEIIIIQKKYEQMKQQQFVLFVAVIKSLADVLVFSNNPGVDLWSKYRKRKMHEGIHCLCGIVSASSVLYNNYPNAATAKK